ncbi:hypothetical protein HK101_009085 [Irineochytrium annulatum]|nr:hypothetical protein HK101_009085 [Irineochytrium annulatum]
MTVRGEVEGFQGAVVRGDKTPDKASRHLSPSLNASELMSSTAHSNFDFTSAFIAVLGLDDLHAMKSSRNESLAALYSLLISASERSEERTRKAKADIELAERHMKAAGAERDDKERSRLYRAATALFASAKVDLEASKAEPGRRGALQAILKEFEGVYATRSSWDLFEMAAILRELPVLLNIFNGESEQAATAAENEKFKEKMITVELEVPRAAIKTYPPPGTDNE